MSWSDRTKEGGGPSMERVKEMLKTVNGTLAHLAADNNLHDDLRDPQVQVAMKHWTGEKRLPPNSEEVLRFQDNYRVMSVLGKIQSLQAACKALGMAVPLDHVVQRKSELDMNLLRSLFPPNNGDSEETAQKSAGQENAQKSTTPKPAAASTVNASGESAKATTVSTKGPSRKAESAVEPQQQQSSQLASWVNMGLLLAAVLALVVKYFFGSKKDSP